MKWLRKERLSVVVLGVVLMVALLILGASPAAARSAVSAVPGVAAYAANTLSEEASPLIVELSLAEDGSWNGTLKTAAGDITLTSLEAAALGLPEVLDPWYVQTAMQSDIQNLALAKKGGEIDLFVNGLPVQVQVNEQALESLDALAPKLGQALALLTRLTSFQLILNFPVASSQTYELDLERGIDTTIGAASYANQIDLGVTMSPAGKLISAGGMDSGTFGDIDLASFGLDPSALEELGIEQADITLAGRSLVLDVNGQNWLAMTWDSTLTPTIWEKAYFLAGVEYTAEDAMWSSIAQSWAMDTQVSIHAFVGDTPQESAPLVSIGRPLTVEFGDDSFKVADVELMPYLGDLGLASGDLAFIKDNLDLIGSVAAKWDGQTGQLRLAIGNTALPYLEVDQGLLPVVGKEFIGDMLPWDVVDSALASTSFTLVAQTTGNAPNLDMLSVQAAPVEPIQTVAAAVTLSRQGGVAVEGETMPLQTISSLAGIDLSSDLRAGLDFAPTIDSASISIGPGGISLGVDGKSARLVWDEGLRANLVADVMKYAAPDVPPDSLAGWAIEQGVAAANQVQLDISVDLTSEQLPPGTVDEVLNWFSW